MTTMATPNCAAASHGRASPPGSTNTRALASTSSSNAAAPTSFNPISLGAAASPKPIARRRWQRPTASTSFPTWALRPAITFAWPMPIRLWLSSSSARGDGSELVPVQPFFSGEPLPENGRVRPPEAPGWGYEIAPEVSLERPHPTSESNADAAPGSAGLGTGE